MAWRNDGSWPTDSSTAAKCGCLSPSSLRTNSRFCCARSVMFNGLLLSSPAGDPAAGSDVLSVPPRRGRDIRHFTDVEDRAGPVARLTAGISQPADAGAQDPGGPAGVMWVTARDRPAGGSSLVRCPFASASGPERIRKELP